MATIAVFLALGGGAYAALKLPKNSVGSKQIKANAVRSSKVKNGSLLADDFKAGQLPQGAKGDKGDPGAPATRLFLHAEYNPIAPAFTVYGHGPDVTAARNGQGDYTVTFPQDISECVAVGSIGSDFGTTTGSPTGTFNRVTSTAVRVFTFTGGTQQDQPFSVAVFC
jgi:hypothetical protein